MIPPCHYVANAVRTRYQDHKLFATGVDFDEDGVERNRRERVVFREIFPVCQFLVLFWPSLSLSTLRVTTIRIYLEEPIRLPSPHQINFSVCLSVCLSVHTSVCPFVHLSGIWKHVDFERRIQNQGVHVKVSVHHPSPPNTYSYVQEVNSGSTRKFVEIYLSHPQDTHPLHVGWRNLSKTAEKSSSSSGCFWVLW